MGEWRSVEAHSHNQTLHLNIHPSAADYNILYAYIIGDDEGRLLQCNNTHNNNSNNTNCY